MRAAALPRMIYAWGVAAVGLPLGAYLAWASRGVEIDRPWIGLAALAFAFLVSDLVPVQIARDGRRSDTVAISGAFGIALLLIAPLWAIIGAVTVTAAVETVRHRLSLEKAAFNLAQWMLTVAAARAVFCLTSGEPFLGGAALPARHLPAVALAGLTYVFVNYLLVAVVYALHLRKPLLGHIAGRYRTHVSTHGLELALVPFAVWASQYSVFLLPVLLAPVAIAVQAAKLSASAEQAAMHDPLTGLPNLALMQERFAEFTENNAREERTERAAVLAVGVDAFREIVECLGHAAADQLLVEVGQRLQANVRAGTVVGRLHGETFAVLTPLTRSAADEDSELSWLSSRLLSSLGEPFELSGVPVTITATAGAAL